MKDGRAGLTRSRSRRLTPGKPWVAYRQFCQFFLAPLAVMSYVDVRLLQLLRSQLDGMPLELASRLLPASTRLRPGILTHVHLQAAAERRVAGGAPHLEKRRSSASATASAGILDSLERTVKGLAWRPAKTTWGDYYEATNYTDAAFSHKRDIVSEAIDRIAPRNIWDLGANDGTFSRLGSDRGIHTVAFDVDPVAVEKNYRRVVERGERTCCRSCSILTNPSARSGGRTERGRSPIAVPRTSCWRSRSCITWRSRTTCRCRGSRSSSPASRGARHRVRAEAGLTAPAHARHSRGHLRSIHPLRLRSRLRCLVHDRAVIPVRDARRIVCMMKRRQ